MRHTIQSHHIVEEQLRDFGCTKCILPRPAQNQTTQFPKPINTDNQSIVTIYLWQASDSVYCPILKLVRRYWQRLQQPCRCFVDILNPLVNRTTSNILISCCILGHQTRCCKAASVLWAPRCEAYAELCNSAISYVRQALCLGTTNYKRPSSITL